MASVSDLFVGPAPLLIAGYRSKISFSLKFYYVNFAFSHHSWLSPIVSNYSILKISQQKTKFYLIFLPLSAMLGKIDFRKNFSPTIVGYTGLRENPTNIMERDKT